MDTKAARPALRITLIYMVVASTWIIASDEVLSLVAPSVTWLQMSKGLVFVAITGALLYSQMNRELSKLGESEAKIRSQALLLDQVSDAIISTDMNFVVRTFNAAAERVYGWTAEEMIGKQFNEVVRTEYYDKATTCQEAIDDFIRNSFWRGEVIQRRKNGELGNFMAATSFIVGANGEREGVVTVNRDITEEKKVAQRLDESEAKFTQAFRSGPVGLAISTLDGVYVEVNTAFCDLCGYSREKILGKNPYELNLTTPAARSFSRAAARANNGHIHLVEYEGRTKHGEVCHVLTSIEQITLDGEPHRLASMINITERKQAEQAIRDGRFPLVVGSSCEISMGILAGFEHASCGVIWLDAHGDYNTPETTISGFFAGMALSLVMGESYQSLWGQIGDNTPIPGKNVVLLGVRDLDPAEAVRLEQPDIRMISWKDGQPQGDIDAALDPVAAPQSPDFAALGGLSFESMEHIIRGVASRFRVRAAGLTAFNPDNDPEGKALRAGLRIIELLGECAPAG